MTVKVGIFMTFIFRNVKYLQKACNWQFVNSFCNGTPAKLPPNDNEIVLKHFPDKTKLLKQGSVIYKKAEIYQKCLLNELLAETGINLSVFPIIGVDKKFILHVDINILQKIGIIKNENEVLHELLGHLEPFPFDKDIIKNLSKYVTIKKIRDIVERHYLAWKFNSDLEIINKIMQSFNPYLIKERSCKNIIKCYNVINGIRGVNNYSMVHKIFLMYMRPFEVNSILSCKTNFFNYDWDTAVNSFPGLFCKPYPYVELLLKVLRDNNFTELQIQNSLPILRMSLFSLLTRLNYLLSNFYLSHYRYHDDFLKLLFFSEKQLKLLVENQDRGFTELQRLIDIDDSNIQRKAKLNDLCHQVRKMLKTDGVAFNKLKYNPKVDLSSELQIKDTINFLKSMKFTEEEILESITIVLCKRDKIKYALKKIKEEEENLQKLGFENGSVPEETNFFSEGTKLRRKTLQLCLYYIDKGNNFKGKINKPFCRFR